MQPIVIIDSGVGGLNTLERLIKDLPHQHYLYFADEKYFPYGEKSARFLIERGNILIDYLKQYNPQMIIIACNTLSTVIKKLNNTSPIPLLDIITPTIEQVNRDTTLNIIGIVATRQTINSQMYQVGLASKKAVIPYAFPKLVKTIEENTLTERAKKVLLMPLYNYFPANMDALILGCTHFWHYHHSFQKLFSQAKIIEPSDYLVMKIKQMNIITTNASPNVCIMTTKRTPEFLKYAEKFTLTPITIVDI